MPPKRRSRNLSAKTRNAIRQARFRKRKMLLLHPELNETENSNVRHQAKFQNKKLQQHAKRNKTKNSNARHQAKVQNNSLQQHAQRNKTKYSNARHQAKFQNNSLQQHAKRNKTKNSNARHQAKFQNNSLQQHAMPNEMKKVWILIPSGTSFQIVGNSLVLNKKNTDESEPEIPMIKIKDEADSVFCCGGLIQDKEEREGIVPDNGMSNSDVFAREEMVDQIESTSLSIPNVCIKEEKLDETESSFLGNSDVFKKENTDESELDSHSGSIKEEEGSLFYSGGVIPKQEDMLLSEDGGPSHVKQEEEMIVLDDGVKGEKTDTPSLYPGNRKCLGHDILFWVVRIPSINYSRSPGVM